MANVSETLDKLSFLDTQTALVYFGNMKELYVETVRRIKRISRQIAKALHINGPFNIQYMARENDILVVFGSLYQAGEVLEYFGKEA